MMSVVVSTRSGLAEGLKLKSFTVIDEKTLRPIEFFDDADTPVSVGIVIDSSSSQTAKLKLISEELSQFFRNSHSDNEYFLMSFSGTRKLLADWGEGSDILARKFDVEAPKGGTALYDSVFAAIEKLQIRQRSRRALLLISDGQDNASRLTFKELRNALRDADVTLHVVGMLSDIDVGSSLGVEGKSILDELSATTGGATFYPKNRKELKGAFSTIAGELRHQYRLGFRPDKTDAPNKWRRIKVRVTPSPTAPPEFKNLSVRARDGYYTH